ncbi:MAG: hypothetical protein G01um101420_401 [Parcubacteria group bacterium Gr01-1014_20]|nr:MAG: hypothetical protein G01um101420_401 [Parcubacteria group bacterium Gr01-1014_20]
MPEIKPLKKLHWTSHSRSKMRYYGLSEARVRRIIHTPQRIEEGVAPETIAMMQRAGSGKHPYELWVMLEEGKTKRKIISAWRYPGVTKPRSDITRDILKKVYDESVSE